MTSVALALPLAEEQRLVADAGRHGHRVVARCSGADDLAVQLETARPELAVAAAAPQYLSSRVVAACDAIGVRLLVVAGTVQERRFAATLGVVDPVDAPFEWAARRSPTADPAPDASAPAASHPMPRPRSTKTLGCARCGSRLLLPIMRLRPAGA